MSKLPVIFSTAFVALITAAGAANRVEEAGSYTLRISSAVEYAFGEETKGTARGAGFLIDRERGWVLTNAHVARRAPATIRANFRNHPSSLAKRIYIDTHLDLAVLEFPKEKIPASATAAELDCTPGTTAGDPVIAFGHPWSLDFTATRGIVSGVKNINGVEMVQTDAAINPGNSGGALIREATGKVIGVNTSGLNKSQSEGMSFATPARFACTILDLLRAGKNPAPPILPVTFGETTNDGELVIATIEGPWAASLKVGDRIMAINDDRSERFASRFLDQARGKENIRLTVKRKGEEITLSLALPQKLDEFRQSGVQVSGMLVSEVHDRLAGKTLMKVENIEPASLAQQAQVRVGDVLLSVDGIEAKSSEAFLSLLQSEGPAEREFVFRREIPKERDRNQFLVRAIEVADSKLVTEAGVQVGPCPCNSVP